MLVKLSGEIAAGKRGGEYFSPSRSATLAACVGLGRVGGEIRELPKRERVLPRVPLRQRLSFPEFEDLTIQD